MSAFHAGFFGALGVLAAAALIIVALAIALVLIGCVLAWQPPRDWAFVEFSMPIQKWITLEEGGFDERAIKRDLHGPYILAPIDSSGREARFRMRQRAERITYRDIAQMRDVVFFRKAKK